MALRPRIYYNAEQKAEMWDRWQRGESLTSIGRCFDRPSSSIFGQLSPSGGIRPPPRRRSRLALTISEREEISRGVVGELSLRVIAAHLGRSPSTISREVNRNGGLKCYRASQADHRTRASRPRARPQPVLLLRRERRDPNVTAAEELFDNGRPEITSLDALARTCPRLRPEDLGEACSADSIANVPGVLLLNKSF